MMTGEFGVKRDAYGACAKSVAVVHAARISEIATEEWGNGYISISRRSRSCLLNRNRFQAAFDVRMVLFCSAVVLFIVGKHQ